MTSRPLYVPSSLVFNTHLILITLCPVGTEATGTDLKTPCFSRVMISLPDYASHRAVWGRPMASVKVFGTQSNSTPLEPLGCVVVMV